MKIKIQNDVYMQQKENCKHWEYQKYVIRLFLKNISSDRQKTFSFLSIENFNIDVRIIQVLLLYKTLLIISFNGRKGLSICWPLLVFQQG